MAKKALIVYFSLSGSTEQVADLLAKISNGTVHPIQVVTPFPEDMYKTNDIAEAQREDHTYPELSGKLPNVADYRIILLGGPVWNGHPATPLLRFLQDVNLGSVPVAPFFTYATDPGDYAKEIDRLLGANSLAALGMADAVVAKTSKATAELQKWWDTVRPR
ncbi:flavodoxin [Schleiferilactobacillus harbinensis]|jgi:flavodoxin|uniref:Flavodoxin-like domain-containing protein n=1 Tax=Schleiferilactobacillus harbinensis DSM 16991 TaxID=1122147 RepID=A0A0R1XEZ2_9LACO|nr:flavodoxin [Schleiferilactobacillus harbinensis]KRM28590.1 hypothetical protein FC91_GL001750 [Schleiferilactobacillus harbinensis DSM 16991]